MVWIEPGNFTMGSWETARGTKEVAISHGFYLGKYEITREQWYALMGTAPWSSQGGDSQRPKLPAFISWHDAQAFTQRLNDHFGEDAYRLPTEAEWEYSCRAGTTTRWFFGDDESQGQLESYAWYEANAMGDLHPVGEKLPNPWGLFDMYGNAWEWVYDRYSSFFYEHDDTPEIDPSGSFWGYYRTLRGSSFAGRGWAMSSAWYSPSRPESGFGGARLLKGEPLIIPALPDSSSSFFPTHEGNIWIFAVHNAHDDPPVFLVAYVLERSEVIGGKQYWKWSGFTPLPLIRGPFRVDEKGIWKLIQERWISDALNELLRWLDANPELRKSQYYQQSSFYQSLEPDQKELLIYDFVGSAIDHDSSTLALDWELAGAVSSIFLDEIGGYLQKEESGGWWSVPHQQSFSWVCCGTEAGEEWIIFQRGLGLVSKTFSDPHGWSAPTQSDLVWARIDGVEYGLHPGPGYPGYRQIETVVASPEVTSPHPVTSHLSPNYPNPFNASTRIPYHLATSGPVRLEIFNTLGQPVRTLVNQFQPTGSYRIQWDARDREGSAVSDGVYLLRLSYPGGEQTRRLLLLK